MLTKNKNQTQNASRPENLFRNTDGAISIMMALVAILILLGLLSLPLYHGLNLSSHSNVKSKLTNFTNMAAEEYIHWKIRKTVSEAGYPVDDMPDLLLTTTDMTEKEALEKLRNFIEEQVVLDKEASTARVTHIALNDNDGNPYDFDNPNGDLILDVYAKMPQKKGFMSSGGTCNFNSTASDSGCTAFNVGKLIPFHSAFDEKKPDIINNIVFSLDTRSSSNTGIKPHLANLVSGLEDVIRNLGIKGDTMHTGLTQGNLPSCMTQSGVNKYGDPVYSSECSCELKKNMGGWTGCAMDNSHNFDGTNLNFNKKNCNAEHMRQWPLVMDYHALKTRRCNADNAVWTYQPVTKGYCHTIESGVQVNHRVIEARWYQACPHTHDNVDDVYQNPNKFLTFDAYLSGNFNSGSDDDCACKDKGNPADCNCWLKGTIIGGGGTSGLYTDKVSQMYNENTARSWAWACDDTKTKDGAYGKPWGMVGKGLVDDVTLDPLTQPTDNCYLEKVGPETAVSTRILFAPHGCDPRNPSGTECSFPEGSYTIRVKVKGLKGKTYTKEKKPDPLNETPRPWKVAPGWAYLDSHVNVPNPKWGNKDGSGIPACPPANTNTNKKLAPYVSRVRIYGGIPQEYLFLTGIAREAGRYGGTGDVNMGSGDSFDSECGPQGGNPNDDQVISNDNCDWTVPSNTFKYPYFALPDTPAHHAEHLWFEDKNGAKGIPGRGVLQLEGGKDNGEELKLGYWPRPLTSPPVCTHKKDRDNPKNSWCRYTMKAYAMSCVREDSTDDDAIPNIAIQEGGLDDAINVLKSGYPDTIHTGHQYNQCALLKNAAWKTLNYDAKGKTDETTKRMLFYIGSCPENTTGWSRDTDFSDSNISSQPIKWTAHSNYGNLKTGEMSTTTRELLKWNNPNQSAGIFNPYNAIAQCFTQVQPQLDLLYVITDSSCPALAAASTCGTGPSANQLGGCSCMLGVDNIGNCMADILYHWTKGARLEVRE